MTPLTNRICSDPRICLSIAGVLAFAISVFGCKQSKKAPMPTPHNAAITVDSVVFRNVDAGVAYAGDDACFSCHEDEYRGFKRHGMAHSFYRLTAETAVEDFSAPPIRHASSGYSYRVFAKAGHYYQEEFQVDSRGKKTHSLVREMQYVVGSGTAARTYLTDNKDYLYELPLTWYTQVKKWDFSPGYKAGNARFDRLVPERCMACHNSYPRSVPFAKGKYSEVPLGIGCERCHGPGALHVDERLSDPGFDSKIDPTIVNPAHLSLDRRLDVCQQCHLAGTTLILREGEGAFDYIPSKPLSGHMSLFYADVSDTGDQISVISHADRMKKSACFIATKMQGKPMECVTCHDPHAGFREHGGQSFNNKCLTCHRVKRLAGRFSESQVRKNHTATADCITCHMPKVDAEEAPHSSFTDHWIRVLERDPIVMPTATHASPRLLPYFEVDRHAPDLYGGMAYVVFGTQRGDTLALRRGIKKLVSALKVEPAHGEGQYLLGFAQIKLGQTEEAIKPLEEAVRLGPGIPERLNALAQAYEAVGREPTTINQLYLRALKIQPALANVRINYGRFLESQRKSGQAMVAYREAIAEQPWSPTGYFNLGSALIRDGDSEEAEKVLLKAVQLNPDYTEALGNLALLYANQGRKEDARVRFEQAVSAAPHDPVALGNLGTFYLNAEDLPRAIDLLRRAVDVDPRYVDGLAHLALALFRDDDMAGAGKYARKALIVDPNNALARQIVAAL